MIELKSKNLFIKSGNGSHYVISKILDFYDLVGKNILLLHYKGSSMSSWVKFSKQEFTTSTLKYSLPEHLFQLDLIVVDSNQNIEENYRTIRQITDLPIIFIVDYKNDHIVACESNKYFKNFEKVYLISKNSEFRIPTGDSDNLENCLVEDLKDEWKSNLKELKIQYIRDKNLRDLLGNVE